MFRSMKTAAVAAVGAILGLGTMAHASPTPVTIQSGQTYDGWTITYPQGVGVTLLEDPSTNTVELDVEKFAAFLNNGSYLISFVQASDAAASKIAVLNESITNLTGTHWSGFSFSVNSPLSKMTPEATFGSLFTNAIGGGAPEVSGGDTIATYAGSQASGATSLWNMTGGSPLVIDANPVSNLSAGVPQVFTFKELPITAVPLPAAAWTSLSGLIGLGLVAYGKNMKKILA